MSIPYESSTVLDIPMPNEGSNIDYPFVQAGDSTTKIYNIHCVVKDADYEVLALDTPMTTTALVTAGKLTSLPFAEDANAYHVGDFEHNKIDGVFRSFNRRFANIPTTTTEATGTEIFTFPGLPFILGVGNNTPVASASSSGTTVTLTTSIAHGLSSGDNFRLYAIWQRTLHGRLYRYVQFGNKVALTGTNGTTLTYRADIGNATFESGGVYPNSGRGRRQTSVASTTQLVREYYLPGVTSGISSTQDIPIEQPFVAYSYSGGKTVTNLSLSTTPNSIEYNALVDNDSHLIMQETIRQWMGNITVLESKQIRAM